MNDRKHRFWEMAEAYLNQPLFGKEKPARFDPFKFRREYRIQGLERCWQLNYEAEIFRLRLEARWQKVNLISVR